MTAPTQQTSSPSLGGPFEDAAPNHSLDYDFLKDPQFANLLAGDEGINTFDNDAAADPLDLFKLFPDDNSTPAFNAPPAANPMDVFTAGFGADDTVATLGFPNADMNQFNDFLSTGPAIPEEVTPMQPATPQQLPVGPPGACFHPAVGWYFPAANQQHPLIQAPQQTLALQPQQVGPLGGFHIPQQLPNANNPKNKKRKQYFGPSAYFEEKMFLEGESSNPNSPADTDTQQSTKRAKTGPITQGIDKDIAAAFAASRRANGGRKRRSKQPAIVQSCICTPPREARIPRPRNAFILFRSMKTKQWNKHTGPGGNLLHNALVSKRAGDEWNDAPKAVKDKFHQLAAEEKRRHAEMYPGYVYAPRGNKLNEFGTEQCSCGAYEANLAQSKADAGKKGYVQGADDDDNEDDENAPYESDAVPMQNFQAPLAPMTMPDFGFPTAVQRAGAAAAFSAMQMKQNAPSKAATGVMPVRRSLRNKATSVSYAEPPDTIEEEMDEDDNTSNGKSALHARPAPITTMSSAPNNDAFPGPMSPGLDLPTTPDGMDFEFNADDFVKFTSFGDMDLNMASRPTSSHSSTTAMMRTDPLRRTRSSRTGGL